MDFGKQMVKRDKVMISSSLDDEGMGAACGSWGKAKSICRFAPLIVGHSSPGLGLEVL